jgi:hypothetical protein
MAGLTGLLPKNSYGDLIQMGNSGSGITASLRQVADGLGNATGMFLSTTQIGVGGSDVGMKRVAASVAAMTDGGGTNLAWLQEAGYLALANNFTSVVNTFANTTLSFNVISGRSYQVAGLLAMGNSTIGEGAQLDFNGGGATMTTFVMVAQSMSGTNSPGTLVSTSLAGVINWTSITATSYIQFMGYFKPSSTGTLILRAAENSAHVSGTLTINANSWLSITDTPTA